MPIRAAAVLLEVHGMWGALCAGSKVGGSDRHGFRGNKVGSLQPSPVFCPRTESTVASHATSMLRATSVHRRGERKGEPQGEPSRSCSVHPVLCQACSPACFGSLVALSSFHILGSPSCIRPCSIHWSRTKRYSP